mgnify:CR=1 FL=1
MIECFRLAACRKYKRLPRVTKGANGCTRTLGGNMLAPCLCVKEEPGMNFERGTWMDVRQRWAGDGT